MSAFVNRSGGAAIVVAAAAALVGWCTAIVSATGLRALDASSFARSLPVAVYVVAGFGAVCAYLLMRLRPLVAVFSTLALVAVVIFASRAAAPGARIWVGWNILFAEFVVATLCSVILNAVRARRESQTMAQSLEKHFSPERARQFTSLRYRTLFAPGTERRPLTMVFARGEGAGAKPVRDCVHAASGTVVQEQAASLFAFWNAPDLQADHATRACKAALRMRKRAPQLRFGIHTGVAIVGNIGTAQQIDYTASGDSVEFAARLTDLNDLLGTNVLISSETRRVMSDQFVTRYLGSFRLKNFVDSMAIYELMGADQDVDDMARALRDSFDQAVYAYQGSDLADAESSFRRVLEVYPNDLPTQFYLQRIAARAGEPVPYDWDGVVDMNYVAG